MKCHISAAARRMPRHDKHYGHDTHVPEGRPERPKPGQVHALSAQKVNRAANQSTGLRPATSVPTLCQLSMMRYPENAEYEAEHRTTNARNRTGRYSAIGSAVPATTPIAQR